MSERLSAETRQRIEQFLDEYCDTTEAICPICVAEYRGDLSVCPQCGAVMKKGQAGLQLLGERLVDDRVALAENASETVVESAPKEVWDGPTDEGTCPRCGQEVDPDTDACEECLDHIVDEMNKEEEEVKEECSDEVAYVEQMSQFLSASHKDDEQFCPVCLVSANEECNRCGGDLIPNEEARDVVRMARLEIVEKWWTPLLSTDNQEWFDIVLQLVADAEVDNRTAADFTDNLAYFSPVLADMQNCRRTLYLRLRDFPKIIKTMGEKPVAKEWARQSEQLFEHAQAVIDDAGFE